MPFQPSSADDAGGSSHRALSGDQLRGVITRRWLRCDYDDYDDCDDCDDYDDSGYCHRVSRNYCHAVMLNQRDTAILSVRTRTIMPTATHANRNPVPVPVDPIDRLYPTSRAISSNLGVRLREMGATMDP